MTYMNVNLNVDIEFINKEDCRNIHKSEICFILIHILVRMEIEKVL